MLKLLNGHRLRRGRFSESGRIYMLTTVVENRKPAFFDFRLGRLVVDQFRSAQDAGTVRSLAWVVMPDHFHWLIELRDLPISDLMCRVKARSSNAYKRKTGCSQPLWQKGYHDRALRRDEDLQQAARYIVANPLRAGLVKRLGDYPLWDAVWL